MDDGHARAGRAGDNAVTGLENEASELGHPRIVRYLAATRADT
jgi:hypothetical protein